MKIAENDTLVYRWHNGDDEVRHLGRFATPSKMEDKTVAREILALPPENKMRHLDVFEVRKGTVLFEGKIAPNFGHLGGGDQVFIPDNLEKSLILKGSIQ